ncbi:MAG: N-acetyl-gamma-glutamyl-phosphate reductase [Treponema sp.]|nr:N-acetyl-gamma-glutamyl-phosphate reductase [Treponema sp.]
MIAGIIGATGYAGAELLRLLNGHPKITGFNLSSVSFEGEKIEDIYPNFLGRISSVLQKAEDVIASSDVVFSALPHGVGEKYAEACIGRKIHYIDLSADFRFGDDEVIFNDWYGKKYDFPNLHKDSIYGLPELNRQKIKELTSKGAVIIGNPGCYPTGALLGVYAALSKGLVCDSDTPVIVNSASGTSGGGREPARSFHYSECADSTAPYKIASHRHSPEIARHMAFMTPAGAKPPKVIFTPHLVPMNRGILSTIYISLSEKWRITPVNNNLQPSKEIKEKTLEIRQLYSDFYKDEPFVRVLPDGVTAATNRVRQSNYCDISVHIDINGSTLIVATAIDNMVKGAAGQAVQNMNILFGFDETDGLKAIPMIF